MRLPNFASLRFYRKYREPFSTKWDGGCELRDVYPRAHCYLHEKKRKDAKSQRRKEKRYCSATQLTLKFTYMGTTITTMQPLGVFPTLRLCVSIVDTASRSARNGMEAASCAMFIQEPTATYTKRNAKTLSHRGAKKKRYCSATQLTLKFTYMETTITTMQPLCVFPTSRLCVSIVDTASRSA